MNKNSIIYIVSIIIIVFLAAINISYKAENVNLQNSLLEIEKENGQLLADNTTYNNINNEMKLLIEELEKSNKELNDENEQFRFDNHSYAWSLDVYENYYNVYKDVLRNQVDMITERDNRDLLAISGMDADYKGYVHYYVSPKDNLNDNLDLIASNLSLNNFRGEKMEFVNIENIDGKAVAVINLYESDDSDVSWMNYYFQGSTGGYQTTAVLVESFLQRESDIGNWIDGVMFTYQGNRGIIGDHVERLFNIVFYRHKDYFTYDEN